MARTGGTWGSPGQAEGREWGGNEGAGLGGIQVPLNLRVLTDTNSIQKTQNSLRNFLPELRLRMRKSRKGFPW